MKQFFWKDKSGRGYTNTWNLLELKKAMKGEKNYDGKSASTWAQDAEVGDRWENAANEVTRIK